MRGIQKIFSCATTKNKWDENRIQHSDIQIGVQWCPSVNTLLLFIFVVMLGDLLFHYQLHDWTNIVYCCTLYALVDSEILGKSLNNIVSSRTQNECDKKSICI